MTKKEAIKYFEKRKEKSLMLMRKAKADTPANNKFRETLTKKIEALDMAISALKNIEKIQIIIDNYFTIGKKSGYECMGEIDRILKPYKKGE